MSERDRRDSFDESTSLLPGTLISPDKDEINLNSFNNELNNDNNNLENDPSILHRHNIINTMIPHEIGNEFDRVDSLGIIHDDPASFDPFIQNRNTNSNSLTSNNNPALMDHRPSLAARHHSMSTLLKRSKNKNKEYDLKRSKDTSSLLQRNKSISNQHHDLFRRKSFNPKKLSHHTSNPDNPLDVPEIHNLDKRRRKTFAGQDDVVIDVDELLKTVNNSDMDVTSSSDSNYNSQPSSRGSSLNSSLDDVCLYLPEATTNIGINTWPDCEVLEEFSKEETSRLRAQAAAEAEEFHFQFDSNPNNNLDTLLGDNNNYNQDDSDNDNIMFSHPIVTNIDVPELGNKKVNEAEGINRLRPKKISPWNLKKLSVSMYGAVDSNKRKRKKDNNNYQNIDIPEEDINIPRDKLLVGGHKNIQYPPHIISNNPEHFRFTYFRPDLDQTVHSPTISGLLQENQKFEELFVAQEYATPFVAPNSSRVPNSVTSPQISNNASLNINNRINNNNGNKQRNNNNFTTASRSQSQNNLYRLGGNSTITGSSIRGNNRITNNNNNNNNFDDISASYDIEYEPFWLDILNPTEEEIKVISKAFGIHPLTTEDIFLGEAHEKVEVFDDYYFVCFRSFDIVAEKKRGQRQRKNETLMSNDGMSNKSSTENNNNNNKIGFLKNLFKLKRRHSSITQGNNNNTSIRSRSTRDKSVMSEDARTKYKRKSGDRHKPRAGELEALNVYIIVFKTGVLTFHFAPTPHPINVRRRTRLLKDYLTVTADWLAYAMIDDITDAFAPMIEAIEDEVYEIEEAILKMHHGGDDSEESEDSGSDSGLDSDPEINQYTNRDRRSLQSRRRSLWSDNNRTTTSNSFGSSSMRSRNSSNSSGSSSSSGNSKMDAKMMGWKRKGDMLARIGACRKRVMSVMRLLGPKADVIKGLAKRLGAEQIDMFLGDIQDHIITMVSALSHYEKLLARSHSNYLAQLNIDMTRVNNDMNDVLGKITILGTVVLPMNVITGLWGMNVVVPGQPDYDSGNIWWFMGIVVFMVLLAWWAVVYTRRRFGPI